jgi:hypothetical protein
MCPLSINPALLLQSYKRSIDCPLVQQDLVAAHLLNAPRNPVSMLIAHHGKRLQHHQIQHSLQQIQLRVAYPHSPVR